MKAIIQLNSHVQQHLEHNHHKRNKHIFHKTPNLSNNKFRHRQMKEMMICGMTSLNYDEDFNIELCSSTPSEKVVENNRKHFSCRSIFILVVTRRGHWHDRKCFPLFPFKTSLNRIWNKNSIYINWKLLQDMKHYWMSATSIVTVVTWQLLLIYSNSKRRLTYTTTIGCNKLQIITNNIHL